jgi:hypothetical protein
VERFRRKYRHLEKKQEGKEQKAKESPDSGEK